MDRARDFVPNEASEISEYFVYCGIFEVHSWCKRSGRAAKEDFLRFPKIKVSHCKPIQVQCDTVPISHICIFPSDGISRIRFTGQDTRLVQSQPATSGTPKIDLFCDLLIL